jgi:hypothetical protein
MKLGFTKVPFTPPILTNSEGTVTVGSTSGYIEPIMETGIKHDEGKPRMELLPMDALLEVAKVLTGGAHKYGDKNWLKGMKHSRLYGAMLRHLQASMMKVDLDPEFGIDHLAHCACCCLFLLTYHLRNLGEDDR